MSERKPTWIEILEKEITDLWSDIHNLVKSIANPKRKGEYKFWEYENKWDSITKGKGSVLK
jgi:gentisate 1,2-dioxygenase